MSKCAQDSQKVCTKLFFLPDNAKKLTSKTIANFGCAGFQEKFDTPPLKPTKTEPSFRKLNSPPTKLCMFFPAHLQARELCPQTYSLSLPLDSPLRQALHTQIARTLTFNELQNLFIFKSSAQPHESATKPLHRAAGHIKGTHTPC